MLPGGYNFLPQWIKHSAGDPHRHSEESVRTQATHTVSICCGSPFDKFWVSALSQIQSLTKLIVHKSQKAIATWDALWRAFPSMSSQLNFGSEKINNPYNTLTLAFLTLHFEFGNFPIAFETIVIISSKCSAIIYNLSSTPLAYIGSASTGIYQKGLVYFRPKPAPVHAEAPLRSRFLTIYYCPHMRWLRAYLIRRQ